ncbi:hypothetical protein Tco_0562903, partial [Tanacetum coccineum]
MLRSPLLKEHVIKDNADDADIRPIYDEEPMAE